MVILGKNKFWEVNFLQTSPLIFAAIEIIIKQNKITKKQDIEIIDNRFILAYLFIYKHIINSTIYYKINYFDKRNKIY